MVQQNKQEIGKLNNKTRYALEKVVDPIDNAKFAKSGELLNDEIISSIVSLGSFNLLIFISSKALYSSKLLIITTLIVYLFF